MSSGGKSLNADDKVMFANAATGGVCISVWCVCVCGLCCGWGWGTCDRCA